MKKQVKTFEKYINSKFNNYEFRIFDFKPIEDYDFEPIKTDNIGIALFDDDGNLTDINVTYDFIDELEDLGLYDYVVDNTEGIIEYDGILSKEELKELFVKNDCKAIIIDMYDLPFLK